MFNNSIVTAIDSEDSLYFLFAQGNLCLLRPCDAYSIDDIDWMCASSFLLILGGAIDEEQVLLNAITSSSGFRPYISLFSIASDAMLRLPRFAFIGDDVPHYKKRWHVPHKLCDDLFVGDGLCAVDLCVLKAIGVSCILNASNREVINAFPDQFEYYNVDVQDTPMDDIGPHLIPVLEWLQLQQRGNVVLIHCREGMSRAPSIAIAALLHRHVLVSPKSECSLLSTFARQCVRARPDCHPNNGFVGSLVELERQLCGLSVVKHGPWIRFEDLLKE